MSDLVIKCYRLGGLLYFLVWYAPIQLRYSLIVAAVNSYSFLESPTKPGDLGQLSHYRVIDELGKGGMGYVFRAEDVKLQRSVALKVMNQKIASTPNSRRRFLHEARAMAAVHHDNVATIFEVGESKGTPFMAMEMLRGGTLEDMKDSERHLGYEEIIDLARQMSRGLAAAHAKGIVHRDIKPANIWIEQDTNRVKILDFGLALASSPVDQLASRGAVVGTPGYLSPEQARSEPLDDRSDLYSLGVVLYELCTGRLPSDAKTVPAQLISILAHRPIPIGELNSEIPAPLCNLIHRLVRKEPRMRPGSARLLLDELDRVESECHVKSEVAQAISKLQLGLQEVVSKQSGGSVFDTESVPDLFSDPLAVPPAPSSPSIPVLMAPVRPTEAKKVAASTVSWQTYWPFAAAVAAVLIILPLLTFLFTGVGRSNKAKIIVDGPIYQTSPQGQPATTPPATERAAPQRGSNLVPSSSNPTPYQYSSGANQQGRPESSRRVYPNQSDSSYQSQVSANRDNRVRNGAESRRGSSTSARPSQMVPPPQSQLTSAGRPSRFQPSGSTPSSGPSTSHADTSKPQKAPDAPPTPPMRWHAISTADGRGADAMVQIQSTRKFGSNLSLGIRTRGNIENNHSYIRFDLESIEESRRWANAADLVLTVVGEERPIGASVRVFVVNMGLWNEDSIEWSTSHSPRGLESLPLLAETIVGPDADPKDVGKNVIRLSSRKLAEAVAKSTHDTITLVLAGTGTDDSMLRFVSREQSASAAPRLELQVPSVPPVRPQGRTSGRVGTPRSFP